MPKTNESKPKRQMGSCQKLTPDLTWRIMKLLFLWLCAGTLLSWAAPIHLEAYGDSLTAGFLAHTSLTETPELPELSRLLKDLAFAFIQKNRKLIQQFESPEKAWPHFVARNLQTQGINIVSMHNGAVSGSRSQGILEQVKQRGLFADSTWGLFFVGHNDLCHSKIEVGALVEQFIQNLRKALEEWDKNHQNSIAFLVPTSPIYQLYPVLENHVWFRSESKTFTCRDAWTKYFPYCPSFYFRYKQGDLESYLKPRGEALNAALEMLAQEQTTQTQNGNRVFTLEAQWPLPLQPQYFAVDCYHIAEPGQKIFAENIVNAISQKLSQGDLNSQ